MANSRSCRPTTRAARRSTAAVRLQQLLLGGLRKPVITAWRSASDRLSSRASRHASCLLSGSGWRRARRAPGSGPPSSGPPPVPDSMRCRQAPSTARRRSSRHRRSASTRGPARDSRRGAPCHREHLLGRQRGERIRAHTICRSLPGSRRPTRRPPRRNMSARARTRLVRRAIGRGGVDRPLPQQLHYPVVGFGTGVAQHAPHVHACRQPAVVHVVPERAPRRRRAPAGRQLREPAERRVRAEPVQHDLGVRRRGVVRQDERPRPATVRRRRTARVGAGDRDVARSRRPPASIGA